MRSVIGDKSFGLKAARTTRGGWGRGGGWGLVVAVRDEKEGRKGSAFWSPSQVTPPLEIGGKARQGSLASYSPWGCKESDRT